MSKNALDAGLGSIMGALVGDAAGGVLEFMHGLPKPADIEHALNMPGGGVLQLAPGQITDDGELTLCLAQALLESRSPEVENHARWYAKWIESRPFDIGNTTRSSLGCIYTHEGKEAARKEGFAAAMTKAAKRHCMDSKANGSLMRATPIGVWGHSADDGQLAETARQDSCLSHPNESCWQAVAAYSIAIAELVTSRDRSKAWERARNWMRTSACVEVKSWLDLIENDEPIPGHPQAGFIKIAFVHAFRCLNQGRDYPDTLKTVLAVGGDTDTNACIAGGLVGAAVGLEGIPVEMRNAVLACDTHGARHPRPDFLTPGKVFPALSRLVEP